MELESERIDVDALKQILNCLGSFGWANCSCMKIRKFLLGLFVAVRNAREQDDKLVATSRLFMLGQARTEDSSLRRCLSLEPHYRNFILILLLKSLRQFSDDQSLANTLNQLDHVSPELLRLVKADSTESTDAVASELFIGWNRMIWQSPDAVTLLSMIVQAPKDLAPLQSGPVVAVGFDWLEWEIPPINPAPAPWASQVPLQSPLETVRHPFWGAMIATLDACTGDYEWQSLILRGELLRSYHRTLGNAQVVLDSLWRSEFGLYPVAPLVITPSLLGDHPLPPGFKMDGTGRSYLPWLKIALEHLHRSEIAIESEGSWRLTDRFRTQLMKDDEHMMAFEAVRQRSYRLARSATKFTLASTNKVAAL